MAERIPPHNEEAERSVLGAVMLNREVLFDVLEQVKEDDPSAYLDMVFEGLTDEDLMVICSNSFYRTVYDLSYGHSTIEACLDYGSIISSDGSRSEEICELELELKSGEVDDLKKLAGSIIALTGCVPFDATKYGRTLAMANGGK